MLSGKTNFFTETRLGKIALKKIPSLRIGGILPFRQSMKNNEAEVRKPRLSDDFVTLSKGQSKMY